MLGKCPAAVEISSVCGHNVGRSPYFCDKGICHQQPRCRDPFPPCDEKCHARRHRHRSGMAQSYKGFSLFLEQLYAAQPVMADAALHLLA